MQPVAKFQFLAPMEGSRDAARVAQVIEDWGSAKFGQDGQGSTVIRKSGVGAIFDRRERAVAGSAETAFDVLEPVSGGSLQTQVRILQTAANIHFQCTLSLGSDSGLLPPHVDIRSPRFIRDIIGMKLNQEPAAAGEEARDLGYGWQPALDSERLFAKCFHVGPKDVETLRNLMIAPQRRLALILVSELQGETLGGDLHERLSGDTSGLAHTCCLSHEASWELTALMDREWSCYNGAIRLFWPFRLSRDDYRVHPLWTRDFLLRRTDSEAVARDRLRAELTERLIEASVFVADDPAFRHFEAELADSVGNKERASAGGDFKALEESYAAENDRLRAALKASTAEIETLKQNAETLMIALRSRERADEQPSAQELPPETVAQAIGTARKKLAGTVAFGSGIDQQAANLNTSAGPPDKILRYLLTLGEMAAALNDGKQLGQSVPIWLRGQGVDCSGESETIKNSKAARTRRTFAIDGQDHYCEFHAKPSDGVPPDYCVRIYFAVTDQKPCVRIGYVGRHFD